MSQQINFYNTKLVKPKDWFSLTTVAIVYAAAAGAMMLYYQQLNAELAINEQSRQQAQTMFEKTQQQLTGATSNSQNVSKVQEQEKQLKALQEKYDTQEKIISAFEQTQSGTKHHVADYMLALSRQTVEKVWLTGFKLDPFKDYVSLMGRAYKSELVPKYIQALSADPIFKGQLFGGLKLKEVEQANERQQGDVIEANNTQSNNTVASNTVLGVTASSNTTNSNAASAPAANNNATNNGTQAPATNSAQPAQSGNQQTQATKTKTVERKPIDLIEFEIKGLDVKPNDLNLHRDAQPSTQKEMVKEPANG